MSKKIKQNSIIEPSEQEIKLYQDIVKDLDEVQIDNYANEYFDLVQKEEIKVSYAKFVIDKVIRPIAVGDTITMQDTNGNNKFLVCLVRKEIEGTDYLIFAMVDNETETIIPEMVYLFHVEGRDEVGMEIIDIVASGPEGERILNIIEGDADVEMVEVQTKKEEE